MHLRSGLFAISGKHQGVKEILEYSDMRFGTRYVSNCSVCYWFWNFILLLVLFRGRGQHLYILKIMFESL